MNDPLQSRINPGIVAKLFPSAESLGAPTGTPPYLTIKISAFFIKVEFLIAFIEAPL